MSFLSTTKYLLSKRNVFTFSGGDIDCEIHEARTGIDSFKAFRLYDERGKRLITTRHPETLRRLIKTKASLTFQIKQWAESRADGTLPLMMFSKKEAHRIYPDTINYTPDVIDIETELTLPQWVIKAVETQKVRYVNICRNIRP